MCERGERNMFLNFITDWWNNAVSSAMYYLNQFLLKLISAIETIYFYLLGSVAIPESKGKNIFQLLFENDSFKKFIGTFFIVAGAIWIICFIVSLIKGMANQDTPGAIKKALFNSFKAILGIVVIPFLCLNFFYLSMDLIKFIVEKLNGGTDSGVAQTIFESGYMGKIISEGGKLAFTESYDKANSIEFIDIGKEFFNIGTQNHYDYFISITGGIALGICMGIATIKLCSRIINLAILYVVSPVVVSTMSVDDGKRYEAWKEVSISKLFSILGSVLAMYIYLVLLQVVADARQSIASKNGFFVGTVFFLVIAIAGALMVIKGSDMLDSIVSQNSGGQDGLSPIAMGHLGRVLGRGIGKTKNALLGKPSAKSGNSGGSNSGGTGNGTFSKNGSYGAWGSLKNAIGNSPMGKALNSIKQNGLVGAGVNAFAGIGTGIKDNHQINKDLKDAGYQHPNFHPILKHEQKQAIKKDRQRLQDFKNQGVDKSDLKELKGNRLGSEEFKNNAIAIAQKYKKRAEEGVYR